MEVTPLAYCLSRLVLAFDADLLTPAVDRARAEIAAIPDDAPSAALVCALCGHLSGWVA